jgi:hypothetical protein
MKHIISGLAIGVLTISASAAFARGAMTGSAEFAHQPNMATMHTMSTPAASRTTTTTQSGSTTTTKSSPSTNTHTTGQPNQSCGSATAPNTPGNSASAPGSAFNPDGTAGTKYAGEQPQNSNNPTSVSQYDVACANQPH